MAVVTPDESVAARQLEAARAEGRFRRDRLAPGVLLTNVTMYKGESSSSHYHTTTRDTFYVMTGQLTVTLEVTPAVHRCPYHAVSTAAASVSPGPTGTEIHTLRLAPGEVLVLETNVTHFTSNERDEPCRFLCIEGVGEYVCIPARVGA